MGACKRIAVQLLVLLVSLSPLVSSADVNVLFDFHDPAKTLFPSNLFTVLDSSQNTFRRVNLPKPDCTTQPVICEDIDVINSLDGFNIQPRLSIPFSGPIDITSVNSDTVYLLSLGSTLSGGSFGKKIGINQIVWDSATNTLHAETNDLLDQHTRYALIVTTAVRDSEGKRIKPWFLNKKLAHALKNAGADKHQQLAVATVFTTQSATAVLEKIRNQIKAKTPAPANFLIGSGGERTVFPLTTVTSTAFNRQVGTAPVFQAQPDLLPFLRVVPGAIGQIAFGKYISADYQTPQKFIPAVGTRKGRPVAQAHNEIYFNLFLPAGARPSTGWPVAIFGHGFTDNKQAGVFITAAKMAEQGIATIVINVVGHGGGPLGTLTVNTTRGSVTFPAGGRGIDQNGDGNIGSTEGSSAASPRLLIGSADSLRQTVADLMQLVRQIQVGVDVDGDTLADLDAKRIYYFGQSFGGIYGTLFLAVEPDVRVGVPNVPGGPSIDIVRLSPVFRNGFLAPAVGMRNLANLPPVLLPGGVVLPQFNENLPLRDQPTVINTVPGAMAIQTFLDNSEWASQPGNPVAYAPHIRKAPLSGVPTKSIILQFAKGDMTVPNPTTSAIIRAGDFADRVTYYRNDLAYAISPASAGNPGGAPRNPHTLLTNLASGGLSALIALQAQTQIASFFASNGSNTLDPDGPGVFFETPIVTPLPETLNYLP